MAVKISFFCRSAGKIYILCYRSSYYNTFFSFYNLFYHTYASLVFNISHVLSHGCLCITSAHSSIFFCFVFPPTRIWRFGVISPKSTHLVPITPTSVVHFIISHADIHSSLRLLRYFSPHSLWYCSVCKNNTRGLGRRLVLCQENEQGKHQKSPHDKDDFIGSAFL